jgi:DnaK suppressor protein
MNGELEITDVAELRRQLVLRLAELEQLKETGAEAARPVTLDQSKVGRLSRMDALQGQQMAAETARRRDVELQRVRAALARIDRDEYGYCLKCEEDINPKRLASDPAATLCIRCARG